MKEKLGEKRKQRRGETENKRTLALLLSKSSIADVWGINWKSDHYDFFSCHIDMLICPTMPVLKSHDNKMRPGSPKCY